MGAPFWATPFRLRSLRRAWPIFVMGSLVLCVRWTKGAGFADAYALIIRPFWPGPAQREWIESGNQLDNLTRIYSLEKDNERLRSLQSISK